MHLKVVLPSLNDALERPFSSGMEESGMGKPDVSLSLTGVPVNTISQPSPPNTLRDFVKGFSFYLSSLSFPSFLSSLFLSSFLF